MRFRVNFILNTPNGSFGGTLNIYLKCTCLFVRKEKIYENKIHNTQKTVIGASLRYFVRVPICAFFNKNRVKFLVVTALFFCGIIIGAICDVKNVSDDNIGYMNNFASAYKLQGVSSSEIFFRALISYLRIFAFIWLSGRFVFLIPLNLFSVAAKGFGLGFTISYLIRWSGFGGIIFGFLILFALSSVFTISKNIKNLYFMLKNTLI